jgi:hypothetical protein
MIVTVFDFWEIKYEDSGKEKVKLFDGSFFQLAQEFATKYEVISVLFYANKLEGVIEKDRFYQKTLTKEELMAVSDFWLEERRKEIGRLITDES